MRKWNKDAPEPLWVKGMTDAEIVQKLKDTIERGFAHEQLGRYVRDVRRRLLPILIDGLAAKPRPQAKRECFTVAEALDWNL